MLHSQRRVITVILARCMQMAALLKFSVTRLMTWTTVWSWSTDYTEVPASVLIVQRLNLCSPPLTSHKLFKRIQSNLRQRTYLVVAMHQDDAQVGWFQLASTLNRHIVPLADVIDVDWDTSISACKESLGSLGGGGRKKMLSCRK